MKINIRRWLRIIHRDLGYIFFGATLIYSISGIALNHIDDWNPNYSITRTEVEWKKSVTKASITKESVKQMLEQLGEKGNYKKHYFPDDSTLKVFLKNGSFWLDLSTGSGIIEKLNRRPIFHQTNYLHYNPHKWWTWFSDTFAVSLFLLAVSGIFLLKGKTGITGRGAWLTAIGLLIPVLFLLMYY